MTDNIKGYLLALVLVYLEAPPSYHISLWALFIIALVTGSIMAWCGLATMIAIPMLIAYFMVIEP